MSSFNQESVLSVHHWTDTLFSFTTTRNPSFRFRNGEFTMIGLKVGEKPLLRAYSVASANYEDRLEFFSIKVPDGPLTSRLQHLEEGDEIIVSRKATGTLVIDNLRDGRNLYLVGTGTGLAPFLSVIKDPETYERFEKVVLLHGCRRVAELAYGEMITDKLPNDELIGYLVRNQLIYYPTVTRDPFRNRGRITDLITSRKLLVSAVGCRGAAQQMLGQIGGIPADADEAARAPGVKPGQAEHIDAVHRRHAAPVGRVAGAVENRQFDPRPVGPEAGGPDDRGDAGFRRIEFGRRVGRRPHRRIMRRGRRIDGVARDVIVDQAANAVIDAIGIVEIFHKVVGKNQPAALDAPEPAIQRHPFEGELAQ